MIDERTLRLEAQSMERELDELRELVEPAAWDRIEHVMRVTFAMYGTGLAHALDCARRRLEPATSAPDRARGSAWPRA